MPIAMSELKISKGSENDFFLKLDGIQGESTDHAHGVEIDIDSWSFGVNDDDAAPGMDARASSGGRDNLPVFRTAELRRDAQSGSAMSGSVRVGDVHFSKGVDAASAALLKASTTRQKIAKAVLTCRKAAGGEALEYLQIQLQDVMVASWRIVASELTDAPMENFVLSYSRIEFTYQPQASVGTSEGKKHAGWDRKLNASM